MGGIVGIFKLNGKPILQEEINQANNAISHRGTDGSDIWIENNVAFGTQYFHISPESLNEKSFSDEKSNYQIVSDSRIDNREELLRKLELEGEVITDSNIILASYEKWGLDCLYHLIGDFAFAIFDKSKNQIFCGRDHLGVRPLYYYYKKDEVFAFASEMKALLKLSFVPKTINKKKVALYSLWLSDGTNYSTETFRSEIKSLQPAHYLKVYPKGMQTKFCWDFNLERFNHLKTDNDFIGAFKNHFIEAVRCRIRTPFKVASHLSGGLDSTAIACVADELTTNTLTTIYDEKDIPSADESKYVKEVLKERKFDHYWLRPSITFWEALNKINRIFDRPEHFNLASQRQLSQGDLLKNKKCRVLLTGHDGDTVVSYGTEVISIALEKLDFTNFEIKVKQYVQYLDLSFNIPNWNKLKKNEKESIIAIEWLEEHIISLVKQKKIKTLWKLRSLVFNKHPKVLLNVSKRLFMYFFKKGFNSTPKKAYLLDNKYFTYNDCLKELEKLNKETLSLPQLTPTQINHFKSIYSSGIINCNEQDNHIGASYGFSIAYPFLDKRFIELCLVLPKDLNFGEGKLRNIQREALKQYYPQAVYSRMDKQDFSDGIQQIFFKNVTKIRLKDIQTRLTRFSSEILDWKSVFYLHSSIIKEHSLKNKYSSMWPLFRIIYLTTWFQDENKKEI